MSDAQESRRPPAAGRHIADMRRTRRKARDGPAGGRAVRPAPAESTTVARLAADLAGRALSLLINRVYGRDRPRPLHPTGVTGDATWRVHTTAPVPVGVPVIDELGARPCVVRHSRAIGLPDERPDIEGVAVRLSGRDGGDLLLAGTGDGWASRHVLVPRKTSGTCSTLIPMRAPTGPILIRTTPDGDSRWELSWSRPGRAWHVFGTLAVEGPGGSVAPFAPVGDPPAGLRQYDVVARLREPAYRRAARQRDRRRGLTS